MDDAKSKNEELTVYWVQAQPLVLSFIASVVPDSRQANDVLQRVALATTRRFAEYDRQRPFVAWATGIARNEIENFQREKGKRPVPLDIPVEETTAKPPKSEGGRVHDVKEDTES